MTNLKKYRKQKGITQQQLALITGLKKNTIALYEQRKKNINKAAAECVYRLSVALSCNMEELLEMEHFSNSNQQQNSQNADKEEREV